MRRLRQSDHAGKVVHVAGFAGRAIDGGADWTGTDLVIAQFMLFCNHRYYFMCVGLYHSESCLAYLRGKTRFRAIYGTTPSRLHNRTTCTRLKQSHQCEQSAPNASNCIIPLDALRHYAMMIRIATAHRQRC